MPELAMAAPAKINLGLQVLSRRADGYHEIVTVLQALELSDGIYISEAATIAGPPSLPGLARRDDLTFRAAAALAALTRPTTGAYLRVEKRIPAGAGLGGGSSDAAAVLHGLDAFWNAGVGMDALLSLAGELGADVPFFVRGGTALATGRGDQLTPLLSPPPRWVLLIKPVATITTAHAYAELRPDEWSDGRATHDLAAAIGDGSLPGELIQNDLTPAATRLVPEVADLLNELRDAGADPAFMSGSGPTCCGLFESTAAAETALEQLAGAGRWNALTRIRRQAPVLRATNGR